MSKLFEEIVQGTKEAHAYMEGVREGYKVTLPEPADMRVRIQSQPGEAVSAKSQPFIKLESTTITE